MKAGWEVKPLGEVCVLENGDRGKNYPGRKAFVSEGIPFINAGHIDGGKINWEGMNYIPKEHFDRISRGKIREGDLLFCLRGSLGKFGHVDREQLGAIASSLVIIRCSSGIEIEFLKYFLRTELCVEQIEKYAGGAAQPNLGATDLKKFVIPLPPLEEQKRIVAVLDGAFDALTRARAHVEANLLNARELFESGLDAAFVRDGEGWKTYILSDVVEESCSLSYGIVQPGADVAGGLPIVRPTDLGGKTVSIGGLKRIDAAKADGYKRTKLIGGELLLCVRGSTGVISVCPDELAGANVTRGIVPIRFDQSILLQEFGRFLFLSPLIQEQIKAGTYGAALMQINIRDLRKLVVTVPPTSIQKGILNKLRALESSAGKLQADYQQKLTDLDALRQSLLQKAFAGELT